MAADKWGPRIGSSGERTAWSVKMWGIGTSAGLRASVIRLLGIASISVGWILGILVVGVPALSAQTAPRCAEAGFRQLDFWIGEWEVRDPDSDPVGTSTIEPIMDGCAIREEWTSGNVRGTSLSMYDPGTDVWRQFWVDNRGVSLSQRGGWDGSSYRLVAERVGSDGRLRQIRMTLIPMDDGTVRQIQERSEDGGDTWSVIFDGRYHPHREE